MGLNKTEIYEAPDVALSKCISLGEAVDYFFATLKATPLLLATPFIHKKMCPFMKNSTNQYVRRKSLLGKIPNTFQFLGSYNSVDVAKV